ncbi:MAG: phosphatidylglycerol lysyltransferase domain-containing protein, partial [Candidatus Planktophila sp.]
MVDTSRVPRLIAFLLVLQSASLVGLLSIHRFPHLVHIVGRDLHTSITNLTEAASLIIAISLLLIARGILNRRRRAWLLATSLQATLIAIGIFHNLHRFFSHHLTSHLIFGAFGATHLLFELALLTLLLIKRARFTTLSDSHTRRGDVTYFVRVSALSILVGVLFVNLDRKYFLSPPSFLQSFEIVFKGFVGISAPIAFSAPAYQERLETTLMLLGAFIAATTIAKILRPIEIKAIQSREARAALSMLLERYPSEDSLAYFAQRDDKLLMWSNNDKAAIAYSVTGGTMVASGDPLGDVESWPNAMENFITEADRHGWVPAIYGCTEKAGEVWHKTIGLEALEIGDEAIVYTDHYSLDTPQMKNVRQTINRARKEENTTITKKISEIDEATLRLLARYANEWRRGGDERGFSMALGRFCSTEDSDAVITWAIRNGEYVGLLQFVPWGRDGLSLDLMRRSPESSPGITELMIHST